MSRTDVFCSTNSTLVLHSLSRPRQSLGKEKSSRRKHKELLLMSLEGLKAPWCLLAVPCPPHMSHSPDCQGRGEEGNFHLVWLQMLLGLLWSSSVSWGSVSLLDMVPSCCLDPVLQHGSGPLTPVSPALRWGGGGCDVLFLVDSQAMVKGKLYSWIE